MKAEDIISSIWTNCSTPSSPRASASSMECHPPSLKPILLQIPSLSPSGETSGPSTSSPPPYPFTPEVFVTSAMKTKNIKGLAGHYLFRLRGKRAGNVGEKQLNAQTLI
ncbi:hypothetical protein PoB_007113500 [Plakobranchus ocellatus]|uniref:Uncharacterized protein n=1 Tax=Plakobranchus ocellatus TaxID=259542 RepID=A0AAV4DKX5_9GAST|nr:hypothetical protein PoB_007113500 [Plakobranchus ocellatus]